MIDSMIDSIPPGCARMKVAVVVARLAGPGAVQVLLERDAVPADAVDDREPVAAAAARLFRRLTGVEARTAPGAYGWVDLLPAGLFDDPTLSPREWVALYAARLPGDAEALEGAWVGVAEVRRSGKLETLAMVTEALSK
jgi:hypothetical protein